MKYLILFLSFYTLSNAQFASAPAYQPFNLSFENSAVGAMPLGWSLPNEALEKGYYAEASNELPYKGKYCMKLESANDSLAYKGLSGSAVQIFDATPYLGKKIRFSSYVRADVKEESYGGFYIAEQTVRNKFPFTHSNQDDPIVLDNWKQYTVEYTVTPDAHAIYIGLYLKGKGKVWIDDIKIEILDQVQNIEMPSPVSASKAKDLLSFAKSYGYVKFFHPSDEIEKLDIETYLYNGIKEIEKANSMQEVFKVIDSRINRIAPSAKLFSDKKSADSYSFVKPKNALDKVAIAKMTNNAYYKMGDFNSGTKRLNIYDSRMPREAATYQIIGASKVRGKKIKYTAKARVRPYGNDAHSELWFRVDFQDPEKPPINLKMPEPITANSWKEYTMEIEIPMDALQIRTGLVFIGSGEAWFDDIKLAILEKGKTVNFNPKNYSFDMKWQPNSIEYWRIPESILKSGYEFGIDNTKESLDGSSLLISTDKSQYVPLPNAGDICSKKIDENMWLALPLTVYDDGVNTLPIGNLATEEKISMNPEDKVSKIAVFMEMWNYLRFYSTVQFTDTEWDKLFLDNISLLTQTESIKSFEEGLNKILRITNNIRSNAWHYAPPKDYTLPFIVDFVNGEVVVVNSADEMIKKGDKIDAVDDVKLVDYLNNKIKNYPGSSEVWKKKLAYYDLVANDFKTDAQVVLVRDGEQKTVPITRNLTSREVQLFRPMTLEWLDSNIIYIDGTRFNDFEMSELMGNFSKAKGIVIDLRGDALLSEHVLGFFVDKNLETYNWTLRTYTNPCGEPRKKVINGTVKAKTSVLPKNVVFISNETSVGKSETMLRIVKKYGIGKIVGEESAGSYDMMTEVKLPSLYNFSFDIYPISLGDDSQIKYKPITPDIRVTEKGNFPEDPKIKKAVEILKENY